MNKVLLSGFSLLNVCYWSINTNTRLSYSCDFLIRDFDMCIQQYQSLIRCSQS